MDEPPTLAGWCTDPWGQHDARWMSDGVPTRLVRNGSVESYEEPPAVPWRITPSPVPERVPLAGDDDVVDPFDPPGPREELVVPSGRDYLDRMHEIGPLLEYPLALGRSPRRFLSSSAVWPIFLGSLAFALPPLAYLGIRAALAARRDGNRWTWVAAIVWSVFAAVVGSLLWLGIVNAGPAMRV